MSSYAIVVGVNHYTPEDKKGLRTLKGAVQDANDFHEWLITKGNVPEKNCRLITSTPEPLRPVKDMIDDALGEITALIETNDNNDADRLYFYFAGHGLGVEGDKENNGLCMANWDESKRNSAALASADYKKKFLNEGLFKEVVIFLDCCRNTKMFFKPAESGSVIPNLGPNKNTKWMVAYATQVEDQAFEFSTDNTETRGVFTRVLLDGLNGAASKDNRTISAADLIHYLYFNVHTEAKKAGYIQEPAIPVEIPPTYPFYFKQ